MKLTKSMTEELIDRLVEGQKCGCLKYNVECFHKDNPDTPIHLHDVLAKSKLNLTCSGIAHPTVGEWKTEWLLSKWRACVSEEERAEGKSGLTKSLQEISKRIEWEEGELGGYKIRVGDLEQSEPLWIAKPSPEADLFQFLLSLNLIEG